MRGFFVRINATAGSDDMQRHILAIEDEARADLAARIEARYRKMRGYPSGATTEYDPVLTLIRSGRSASRCRGVS